MIVKLGPVSYVSRCFKRVGRESAVGIKVLYYHVGERYGRKWGADGLPDAMDFLVSQRDIRIIHLKRRNRLKSLTSMRVAAGTGKYLATSDVGDQTERGDSARIRLTPDECEEEFRQVQRWEKRFDDAFQDHKLLEVYYEDLVAQRQAECDRILDFLGVARRSLVTRMTKQRKSTLSEVIENYDDLKKHFAGTEWADYFAD
jgi:LPS sulfotransferase NodH